MDNTIDLPGDIIQVRSLGQNSTGECRLAFEDTRIFLQHNLGQWKKATVPKLSSIRSAALTELQLVTETLTPGHS